MYNLVVARYNEDINWINDVPLDNMLIYLYNKGPDVDLPEKIYYNVYNNHLSKIATRYNKFNAFKQPIPTTIKLNFIKEQVPNIGREAHTYVYHIVKNYANLNPDDVTVFTQGRYHDHVGSMENFKNMVLEADQHGFCHSRARYHNIPMSDQPLPSFRLLEWPKGNFLEKNRYDQYFGEWFNRLLNKDVPELPQYKWIPGAIFAIKNNIILEKPLSFYEELLREFHTNSSQPEVAHFFERAWYYIFF